MNTRFACWLDGRGLQDVDPAVCVTDIRENPARLRIETGSLARDDGLRLTGRARERLDVTVCFAVRQSDPGRRALILDDVLAWAGDGFLTVNYRPGQRLRVRYTDLPALGSSLRWTDTLSVTFTAFAVPYWEDATPAVARAGSASTRSALTLVPRGNADACLLEAEITAAGAVNTITLSAPRGRFSLTGLGLSAGRKLTVAYEDGLLRLAVDGISVLDKRGADSTDDIPLTPRVPNTIVVAADGPCTAVVRARGRYR